MTFDNPYYDEILEKVGLFDERNEYGPEEFDTFKRSAEVELDDPDFWYPEEWEMDEYIRPRRYYVLKYAWAIPNREAIEALVEHGPILEVHAGTGYWAHLIEEMGGNVIATDATKRSSTYVDVQEMDARQSVQEYPDRTLFACWPAYAESWTSEYLEEYDGDTLIFVGEPEGGCTGDERYHNTIRQAYGPAEEVIEIPQWYGMNDQMYIFQR